MGPKTKKLHSLLSLLIDHLKKHEEHNWAEWAHNAKAKIENSDYNGIEIVLHAYGGMGSFSDLVLHPMNGHKVAKSDVSEANETLAQYRTEIYSLSKEISRNAEVNNKA